MDPVPVVDAARAVGAWARTRPGIPQSIRGKITRAVGAWARAWPGRGAALLLLALVWLLVAGASRPCQAAGEAVVRGGTVTFPPFEVNIDDGGKIGRLRLAFEVLFSDEQGAKIAASGQVREDLLLFFRDKTAAQLLAPRGRDALRAQLLQLLNASIGGPKAIRLYFLEYLVIKAERP
ncbi:flagellar FliL protein [Desulfovibrio aerotolerans]|uniref:Flagellar protein FliL n=1 Tax=Solidesulfovibrio aerotolerans TaxID=295255 RepID=A0A7C9MK92_9BACT|nr:flagellar FliL protein [Solidesulfovibrio aerotolerans]